jgi:hypothetical protein
MRVLVVYESMFGNTQKVAVAVAEGLATHGRADAVEVGEAAAIIDGDVDLLVVGGPTHAHGLSRKGTRDGTANQADGAPVSSRTGAREWIASLTAIRSSMPVATFDTRFAKPRWLTGSAAVSAAKLLRQRGCTAVAAPESFYVDGTTGPLSDGELDRARRWGEALAGAAARGAGPAGSAAPGSPDPA